MQVPKGSVSVVAGPNANHGVFGFRVNSTTKIMCKGGRAAKVSTEDPAILEMVQGYVDQGFLALASEPGAKEAAAKEASAKDWQKGGK